MPQSRVKNKKWKKFITIRNNNIPNETIKGKGAKFRYDKSWDILKDKKANNIIKKINDRNRRRNSK